MLLLILISGCSQDKTTWIKPDSATLGCDDYLSLEVPNGVLNNNVWNKQAAKGQAYEQCLESRAKNGKTEYGWSWRWPDTQRAVFGQPQIKIGQSPWQKQSSFGQDFPMPLNHLKSLNLKSELEVDTNSDHNVAISLWMVDRDENDPKYIQLELMIWTYYTENQFKPGGSKESQFEINGEVWEYWRAPKWDDVSGVNKNTWQHIAFRLKQPKLKAEVDIKALIDYGIAQGHINPEWIISDLEFGTEVMAGEGIAWLKQFDVEIVKTASARKDAN